MPRHVRPWPHPGCVLEASQQSLGSSWGCLGVHEVKARQKHGACDGLGQLTLSTAIHQSRRCHGWIKSPRAMHFTDAYMALLRAAPPPASGAKKLVIFEAIAESQQPLPGQITGSEFLGMGYSGAVAINLIVNRVLYMWTSVNNSRIMGDGRITFSDALQFDFI